MWRRRVLAVMAISLIEIGAAQAGSGEHALSLTTGFATFADDEVRALGGAIGGDYEYGLSDAFGVRASLAGSFHRADGEPAMAAQASAGLTYAFDVIKYVPYATVGIGVLGVRGDTVDDGLDVLAEVGGGLDVLHSRSFSYGLAVRFESRLGDTSYLTALTRLTWRWGFF